MIRVENVSYGYEDDQGDQALKDVSLTVQKGEFLAVLGHNGSGKSTLAKLLNALFVPTRGRVMVCGMDTAVPDHTFEIRQKAGMVFQNPDNQMVATIVEEDVAFGLENLGVPPDQIRARVDESLARVRMGRFKQSAPHMLSGGQKQRVAIAGVIAMRPELIIFDEPTAMLDPLGRQEVMESIAFLNREMGITIVLITHFMEEAALADRLLVMEQGRVVLSGTPREVFSQSDKLRDVGLDVPLPTELAHRLIAHGVDVPADVLTGEELLEALCR